MAPEAGPRRRRAHPAGPAAEDPGADSILCIYVYT